MSKQCPLNDDYRFKTCCRVTTCKYYTEKTKHKCMGLDTVFSATEKGVTYAELSVLKFPELTKKEVMLLNKTAQDKVRAALLMHKAVQTCVDQHTDDGRFVYSLEPSDFEFELCAEEETLEKIVRSEIFQALNMKVWMLDYVLAPAFLSELGSAKIHTLFSITEKELLHLRHYITGKKKCQK